MEELLRSWEAPLHIQMLSESAHDFTRNVCHIEVNGDNIPPPIKNFLDMQFPAPIMKYLKGHRIEQPTPIQVQGLPVILTGRNMLGIGLKGSGNTLAYVLPLILVALQQELRSADRKGPVGLIICSSVRAAIKTHHVVCQFLDSLIEDGYPNLTAFLYKSWLTTNMKSDHISKWIEKWSPTVEMMNFAHIVVTHSSGLKNIVEKRKMSFDYCRYITFDGADELVQQFEYEMKQAIVLCKTRPQTILFSNTLHPRLLNFARRELDNLVTVNVVRAEAANLDVIQEFVQSQVPEAKMDQILKCLHKTPPPVVICCENKVDVDEIRNHLLLKGVEALAIDGNEDDTTRHTATLSFKTGKNKVLVATNIILEEMCISESVEHVIIYYMPAEIVDYVHMIGWVGRRKKKTGITTTFISNDASVETLSNLRQLLKNTNQRIPQFLVDLGG